jgi:hypothetical protein
MTELQCSGRPRLRLLGHGRELRQVAPDVGHLMRDDQMMLGIDGNLDVVAHNTRAATAGRHRAGIGIGQRYLLLKSMTAIIGSKILAANQPNSFFCICMTIVHTD